MSGESNSLAPGPPPTCGGDHIYLMTSKWVWYPTHQCIWLLSTPCPLWSSHSVRVQENSRISHQLGLLASSKPSPEAPFSLPPAPGRPRKVGASMATLICLVKFLCSRVVVIRHTVWAVEEPGRGTWAAGPCLPVPGERDQGRGFPWQQSSPHQVMMAAETCSPLP